MKRRQFITLLGGAAAVWPLAAHAQQPERIRRIGALMNSAADDQEGQARMAVFLQRLQELGWTDGRNVRIETRWAGSDAERLRRDAGELVALAPDVILASASPSVAALQQASRSVSIVFANVIDPVGAGFVANLARPGGNATGFLAYEYGLSGKWLELLKEISPRVTRAAVLRDPALAAGIGQFAAIQSVAPSFGVELVPLDVRDAGEIERAIDAFARAPNGGLIVTGEHVGDHTSQIDRHAGGPEPAVHGLPLPLFRHGRRPDLLRARFDRRVQARGRLRRPHPQRREASRPARAGADQVRVGDQPQDRKGDRP